ncbi:MAG: LemA family protein [Proteobacteria bacterium]|nr:LemA family protein [Pseudomonadota bacterium]
MMPMKFWIPIVAFAALLLYWGVGGVNSLVRQDEEVNAAWAQVQNQYQRRMDLIPNLVSTVKGYASHEKETLQAVIEARANATKVSVNLDNAKQFQEYMNAQSGLSSALSRLLAVSENYPNLKANQNFLALQDQLEGTENRIAVARKDYIAVVRGFNQNVRTFPGIIWAMVSGLRAKPVFDAAADAQRAPVVAF